MLHPMVLQKGPHGRLENNPMQAGEACGKLRTILDGLTYMTYKTVCVSIQGSEYLSST
jgi:hypothetical protein